MGLSNHFAQSDLRSIGHGSNGATQHFRPSSVAVGIHNRMVSGKYAMLSPSVYVEYLQCECQDLDVLPHPTVLCRFFSWNFGQRRLSVRQFRLLSTQELRELHRSYDMTVFSKKNALPVAEGISRFNDLVDALGCLRNVAPLACKEEVVLSGEARINNGTLHRNHSTLLWKS